ncbi:SOS response-associated peptidase family protein [Paraburkholderia sediminicola]|uniref:SOS response-associated peptidase family protein n=1 Tax=Paraburkholderia sediminicola TaxID=458836 RepID=UPI0038B811E3
MCYSAQIVADYRKYVKRFGADMNIHDFARLYWDRADGSAVKTPRSMDAAFADPATDDERQIKAAIDDFAAKQTVKLEQDLFKQRTRLADAERTLLTKTTKAATESKRIATDKIETALRGLDDLRRSEVKERDSRIFPGWYAPVMIVQDGKRVIVPMRFRCRLPGWTAKTEIAKDGTYNARRDSLSTAWRKLFGYQHGIIMVDWFYENVKRDGQNVVLRFDPTPGEPLLIACLWNRWTSPGEPDLLSFGAITDEPPPEVAAAGHDRCIVPIKPENIDAWLNPDPKNLAAQYAILDDRVRPYYEHRLAA